MTTTTIDLGEVAVGTGRYSDETVNFATGATYVAGTILARNSSSLKLVPFAIGGATGTGIPVAVLGYDLTNAGSGDLRARVIVGGTVNADRLVVHADGDNSNVTAKELDELRDYGIFAVPVKQLNR